jgi:hypothetical protein
MDVPHFFLSKNIQLKPLAALPQGIQKKHPIIDVHENLPALVARDKR